MLLERECESTAFCLVEQSHVGFELIFVHDKLPSFSVALNYDAFTLVQRMFLGISVSSALQGIPHPVCTRP